MSIAIPVSDDALRKMSNCKVGDLSEGLFFVACIVHDWEAFKAFGHENASDWIIKRGHIKQSVQVKTATIDERGDYCVEVQRGGKNNKRAYAKGDFDVLAAYLPDRNQFVFWTFDDIRGRKKVRYNPARHRQPGNWELIDEVAQSQTNFLPKDSQCPTP